MHPIVENDPQYRRIIERRDRLHLASAKFAARQSEAVRLHSIRQTEYRARLRDATLNGEPPPPPPPAMAPVGDAEALQSEREEVAAAERRWIADNAERIEAALREREREVYAELQPMLDRLREVGRELDQIRSTGRRVRGVLGDTAPVATGRLTLGDVANRADAGRSVLDPNPRFPHVTFDSGPSFLQSA